MELIQKPPENVRNLFEPLKSFDHTNLLLDRLCSNGENSGQLPASPRVTGYQQSSEMTGL